MKNERPVRLHPHAGSKARLNETIGMPITSEDETTLRVGNVYSTTRFGKVIEIRKGPVGRGYLIHVAGGGKPIPQLEGQFTNIRAATHAIEAYTGEEIREQSSEG